LYVGMCDSVQFPTQTGSKIGSLKPVGSRQPSDYLTNLATGFLLCRVSIPP
jgi:hypothetical protein